MAQMLTALHPQGTRIQRRHSHRHSRHCNPQGTRILRRHSLHCNPQGTRILRRHSLQCNPKGTRIQRRYLHRHSLQCNPQGTRIQRRHSHRHSRHCNPQGTRILRRPSRHCTPRAHANGAGTHCISRRSSTRAESSRVSSVASSSVRDTWPRVRASMLTWTRSRLPLASCAKKSGGTPPTRLKAGTLPYVGRVRNWDRRWQLQCSKGRDRIECRGGRAQGGILRWQQKALRAQVGTSACVPDVCVHARVSVCVRERGRGGERESGRVKDSTRSRGQH